MIISSKDASDDKNAPNGRNPALGILKNLVNKGEKPPTSTGERLISEPSRVAAISRGEHTVTGGGQGHTDHGHDDHEDHGGMALTVLISWQLFRIREPW